MLLNIAGSTDLETSKVFHYDGIISETTPPKAGYFCKVASDELVVGAGATKDDYLGVTIASSSNLGKDCEGGDLDEYLVEGSVFVVLDDGVIPKEGDFVDIAGDGRAKIGTTNQIGIFLGVAGEPTLDGKNTTLAWIKG